MEVLQLFPKNRKKVVEKAIRIIKKGGVVISPTDTVYGLLADATNKKAVEKVFKIKKRPRTKAIAIFVSSIKQAQKLAEISREQEAILKKHWPGKDTFILKLKKVEVKPLPKLLLGKMKTIGLRIPDYKLVLDLLKNIKKPLAQTSANISSKPASTKIQEILKQFKILPSPPLGRSAEGRARQLIYPDLVIDAGNLPKSKPSKVIDLTKKKPKILRR